MKKNYSIILVIILIFPLLFTSCSSNKRDSENEDKFSLNHTYAEMEVGDTLTISTTGVSGLVELTFESSDDNIASVKKNNTQGIVCAISKGQVIIKAIYKGIEKKVIVTVKTDSISPVKPDSISLNESELYLLVQEEFNLFSHITSNITWEIVDNSIAQVDSSGLVTGIRIGETTVIATAGGETAECRVKVVEEKVNNIENIKGEEEHINYYGRNYLSPKGYIFINQISGFELKVYGRKISMFYISAGNTLVGINVTIDNKIEPDNVIYLPHTYDAKEYVLADNLSSGWHTVKVTKTTESRSNTLALQKISTDGYFGHPLQKPIRKMEVYGDSITAGAANLKEKGQADSSSKGENALLTYAYYAANILNSQLNMLACTGLGMYNTYGNYDFVAYKYYDKYSFSTKDFVNSTALTSLWDFSTYIPDLVIINLGTNDVWSNNYNESELLKYYQKMIDEINQKYMFSSTIILPYGMMTQSINSLITSLSSNYENVYSVKLPERVNGHPSQEEHLTAGMQLVNFIKSIMDW